MKKSDTVPRGASLYAAGRLAVTVILQLWMMYYFAHEGALGGTDMADDTRKAFLFALVPTIAVLLLLPLMMRGSRRLKLIAVILSLFPAWMAFQGWTAVFDGLSN